MLFLLKQPKLLPILLVMPIFLLFSGLIAPGFTTFSEGAATSNLTVGLIIAVFGIGRLVGDLPAARLSQQLGERSVLVGAALMLALTSILMAVHVTELTMLVGRAVQGIASGLFMTAALIYVAHVSRGPHMADVFALYQTSMLIGAAVGPFLGGIIIGLSGVEGALLSIGAISIAIAAIVLALFDLPEPAAANVRKADHFIRFSDLPRREWPLLASCLAINFMLFLTRTTVLWFLVPTLAVAAFAATPAEIGMLLGVCGGANLVSSLLSGRAVRRLGVIPTIIAGSVLSGAAIMASQPLLGLAGLHATLALLGIGTGLLGTSASALAVGRWGGSRVPTLMASMRMAGDAGFLAGPVLVGLGLDYGLADPGLALLVIGATVVLVALPWIVARDPGVVPSTAGTMTMIDDTLPRTGATGEDAVLSLDRVTLSVASEGRLKTVVRDVSFAIRPGEFYAIVGESGSGKTMIARAVMRLLPDQLLSIDGSIRLDGELVSQAPERRLRHLRGKAMSMIFQEPMTSLNPLMVVEDQIGEVIAAHRRLSAGERRAIIEQALADVRFHQPRQVMRMYPHELSGGMRQRVMIAMALANTPRLLIADEPTTALDVTIQREIMEILARLSRDNGLAVLFVSHDLALVRQYADRIGVLYGGVMMEEGPAPAVIGAPAHPYTAALLDCVPARRINGMRRSGIEGSIPSIGDWSAACRFADRCARAAPACEAAIPLGATADGRSVRCVDPLVPA